MTEECHNQSFVVATVGGQSMVLATRGDAAKWEVEGCGPWLSDIATDCQKDAPAGLSVWEGTIRYWTGSEGDCDVYFEGAFRPVAIDDLASYGLVNGDNK